MQSLAPPLGKHFSKLDTFAIPQSSPVDTCNIRSVVSLVEWASGYHDIRNIINQMNQIPQGSPNEGNRRGDFHVEVGEDSDSVREEQFQALCKQWKQETEAFSSVTDIVMHPAYQRIMSMGKQALPFILADLRDASGHWFHALEYIAGSDVAATASNMSSAKSAWLEWGYRNGYI
jgi:hypothetical protein